VFLRIIGVENYLLLRVLEEDDLDLVLGALLLVLLDLTNLLPVLFALGIFFLIR